MGKQQRSQPQEPEPRIADPSSPQEEDPEYVIGAGQYDDLSVFWSHQLSQTDRLHIISISPESLLREFHLHSVEVSSEITESTLDTMAKICKFFTHSLEARKGCFKMNEIDTEFPNDIAFAWILIGLLEKRLVEYRQIGSVWVQIFWSLIFLAWIRPVAWTSFAMLTVFLLVVLFSSIRILVPIRKWIYYNMLSFFDSQMIPTSIAPLLLFGPGILIALNRMSEWTCSLWPLMTAVPAIVCAIVTNIVEKPSHVRAVYKLSIASVLLFNLVLVSYVVFGISYWYGLCVGLIFNWNISSALVGMIFLGLIVAGAFLRDVISACRNKKTLMMICLVALPVLTSYGYMRWSHIGFAKKSFTVLAVLWCACVGVPKPSSKISSILSRLMVLGIDLFQLIVMVIQAVTATCIIFSSSPKLGIEWVKYLGKTFTTRPVVPQDDDR